MITTTARLDLRNDDVAKILISLKSNENHPKVQKLPSIKEFISYQEYPGHSIKSKHFHLATTLNQKTHLTFISNNDLYSKDLAHDHLYRLPTVTKCDPFVGRSTVALPVSYQKLNVKSLESNFTPSISQTLSKAADLVVNPVSLENSVVGDTNSPSTKFSKKRKACEVHSPGHDSKYGTDSDNQKSPASSSTGYDEDIPRRQALRFPEDQYTPKWVRYSGPKREGLCELCTYGKWLQLKDSAFWYHKQ